MDSIYSLLSDGELTDEIAMGLRNRSLDQKIMYLKNGVDVYYDEKKRDKIYSDDFSIKEIIDIGIKGNLEPTKGKKTAFISLGCGNSKLESDIFTTVGSKYGYMDYFGVDSSRDMLERSLDNLATIKDMKKKYICADFSSGIFKRELTQFTHDYDKRFFVFLSNTFGNLVHTNITDILFNLLNKGERIWLDVRLRKGIKAKDDVELFNIYSQYLNEKLFFLPLENVGIPFKNGKMFINTFLENSLGAIQFSFNFLFTKKTRIFYKDGTITFLPEESIKLQEIYAYDPKLLIQFMKEHSFDLIKVKQKGYRGHFIFERF